MSWTFDNGTILMKSALLGGLGNNVFVVACADTGKGVIIDAACETDSVLELADGTDVQAILTTHGHHDHVGSVEDVAAALEIPFFLHPADNEMAAAATPVEPTPLSDGLVYEFGETSLVTMHTPGHTPGSVCFLTPGMVISGDTLFPGGPGTCDYGGHFPTIVESIRDRLFTLDGSTKVYPGHGPTTTTIAAEQPSLPEWIERGW